MSFILDALKKSEAERQRRAGPTLLEVRVALPRRRFPIWALALGALLLVNAALLAWFVWLRPATSPGPAAITSPTATSASAAAGTRSRVPAPPAAASERSVAAAAAHPAPSAAVPAQRPTGHDSQVVAPQHSGNPADFVPAVSPAAAAASARSAASASTAAAPDQAASASGAQQPYAGLPTLDELAGSVPPMHLDLLVHSANAAQSYALIDMQQAHVGDKLSDGAKVVAITHTGVVLDYHGQQFMLTPR